MRGSGKSLSQQAETSEEELARRHRAATNFIYGALTLTLLLVVLSLTGALPEAAGYDPTLDISLRVAIVFFGLGAVALRRARFSAPRLQAVAGLRGASGLLETLQKTTVLVALIAVGIALMGFALTYIRSGLDETPAMIWIGLIAAAVLLYAYPRRAAWRRVLSLTEQAPSASSPPAKGTVA